MADRIKINEADLNLIEKNLIEYLNSTEEFKGYNFKAGAFPAIIRVAKFMIRNLSFQLNKSIQEIFMDTATLEESIYSLIQNFNYIPELNRPAKRYLKVVYDIDSLGYVPKDGSSFKILLNTLKYTDDYVFIPTLRDKWQQDYYTNASASAYIDQNMFYYYLTKVEKSGGGYQLEGTMPVYQAEWTLVEHTVDTTDPTTQIVELIDGAGDYYGDKVVKDSIRVFVKEDTTGSGTPDTWYEYDNLNEGLFDTNLRAYNLVYDVETGLSVQFDIDHLSRTLLDDELVRIYFAKTEGEDINDEQGNNEFDYEDVYDFQIYEIETNGTETQIMSMNSTSGSAPRTITPTGSEDYFSAQLLDGENNLALFDNGLGKQSLDSIKVAAPLFRVTQGRAVTESDYNYLLSNKFTEYKDIKAWGGQREYFDISDMIQTSIDDNITTGTNEEITIAIKQVISQLYSGGTITIDSVDYSSFEDGDVRRDLGFVYYTFFDDSFQFVNSSENTEEIVKYLDKYKILTIYFRYFNPLFTFIKPKIKLTLNSAYASDFSIYEMKQNILSWFNDAVSFDRVVDIADLNGYLLNFDAVDAVDSISYTGKLKFKNELDDFDTDFMLVRTWTRFLNNLNNPIKAYDASGNLITVANIVTTDDGGCTINGTDGTSIGSSDGNKSNKQTGSLRFQIPASLQSYNVLYIDNIKFSGNKVYGIRESVVGIESIDDIELVVE